MNLSPTGNGRSSLLGSWLHGKLETLNENYNTNITSGYSNSGVGNTSNYTNTINVRIEEQFLRIQEWLSPLEPHKRHQDVRGSRLHGVGEWVLRRNEFDSWRKSKGESVNRTLLCYGGQGVGKTYISSLVIDTLRKQTWRQGGAVIFLYCDYQAQKDQSAVNMVGSLVRQAALRAPVIPSEIKSAFDESMQEGGDGLQLPDMVKLFVKVVGHTEVVYLCVDAVDEVLPQHRFDFLRALRQILQDAPNVRLFLTGRSYIRAELDRHLTKKAYAIHTVADQRDITLYLRQKMGNDKDPGLMTEELKKNIMTTMVEKASEVFLPVALNIEAILGETSLARRRQMFRKVATTGVGLDSVYAQTLQRIREQRGDRSRLGIEVLMWASHAERPLRIDELCHALAVEMKATDPNLENVLPQDTVLGSCLGLAVVDKETLTVRLIHYTLQEYLSQPGVLPYAHRTLGQTCLTYLNCDQVKRLPVDNVSSLGDMPFLEYSSLHWGRHAKIELSDYAKSLAVQLLNQYDSHISSRLLYNKNKIPWYRPPSNPSVPGLHCASYFGISEVAAALIEMRGCDINQGDCMGRTPLMWASQQGNQETVALLLTRGDIDPNKSDGLGGTPLWWASYNGHEGVVRLLLARDDLNPNLPNNDGETPLWCASFDGHEGVTRLLLARDDVDPAKPDNNGRTPLWHASLNGNESTVRLLLMREGVNLDRPDKDGRTPLSAASGGGHEAVVRLLLTRKEVNPDKLDNDGRTPLWHASLNGNDATVRLLLIREEVNPDKSDYYGQTPLSAASENGQEAAVRLLLAREEVNPDKPDCYGQTPLSTASGNGHEEVMRLLLTREEVNPDKLDNDGRTPLWHASLNGNESTARLLLIREEVNPDEPDNNGRTPLSTASGDGHEAVVRLLLTRKEVNPDKPDNDGRTPLRHASLNGSRPTARLLLTRGEVNPDRPGNDGQTPLSAASRGGHEAVVRLLLTREVDPDKPDNDGRTPLWHASLNANESVVRLLLSRDDVNPNKQDNYGRTLLWWASGSGETEAVRGLLTRRDVDPDTPDNIGRTPLLIASMHGHRGVVALLQRRKNHGPLPLYLPNNISYPVLNQPLYNAIDLKRPPLDLDGDDYYLGGSYYYPVFGERLLNCQYPGCERVGESGFKRRDNLYQHLRGVHGIQPGKRSRVGHSVLQRPSSVIEPRELEGERIESGLLKMGIEREEIEREKIEREEIASWLLKMEIEGKNS